MAKVVSLDVEVTVEERKGYFAATCKPFAITEYAKTPSDAEKRVFKVLILLLENHAETLAELSEYLNRFNVKHVTRTGVKKEQHLPRITRECKQEIQVRIPVNA